MLDDVEHRRAEGTNKPAGVNGADAFDHAGAEIALNAGKCVRRGDLDEHRLELPAMLPIGDPAAGGGGVLAWRDTRRVTNQRDQVAFSPDLEAQHAKATVGVVKRDSLDKTGELLERGLCGGRSHVLGESMSGEAG